MHTNAVECNTTRHRFLLLCSCAATGNASSSWSPDAAAGICLLQACCLKCFHKKAYCSCYTRRCCTTATPAPPKLSTLPAAAMLCWRGDGGKQQNPASAHYTSCQRRQASRSAPVATYFALMHRQHRSSTNACWGNWTADVGFSTQQIGPILQVQKTPCSRILRC
jgi:hypothetical protein